MFQRCFLPKLRSNFRIGTGPEVVETHEGSGNPQSWLSAFERLRSGIPLGLASIRRFLRHGRALKHGLAGDLPGRLLASPALADDVSSPSSSYPSAGCSSAEPASVSLDKIGGFPVSVSFRVYRVGNGQRELELVASGIADDFAVGGEFGQGGANFGRANATEFLQLLNR